MSELICDHCLIGVNEENAVYDEIEGKKRVFCCKGCEGIYHVLHDAGLEEFYDRRQGWDAGPPQVKDISPELFQDAVREEEGIKEIDISLSGIRCASCIWLIEKFLSRSDGIIAARVNYATHRARIRWSPDRTNLDTILSSIASIGYKPLPYTESSHNQILASEKKDLLIRFGTASFFSMQLMLYTITLYAGYFQGIERTYKTIFQLIAWGLATPVMFYSGYPFIRNTVRGIKNRTLNMDTLIFLGSFSAYTYSFFMIFVGGEVYFDTSSMIITLILLGRFIESGAKSKATQAIQSLIELQPREARLIVGSRQKKNGSEAVKRVPVSTLRAGDLIEVIPGDRIPVDCRVLDGFSEVDESMLTGESMPVQKNGGAEVFGGTINLNSRLTLEVIRTGKTTVLSQIIETIEDAQARKAPVQTVADGIVKWFVPTILFISFMTFLFWFFRNNNVTASLINAVSVLVIACPCALGLATPLAILRGSMELSSIGILIRGGDILEAAARTQLIAFDKTGTLTQGKPELTEIVSYGIDKSELHVLAASVEKSSEHVISRAIKKGISNNAFYPVEDFKIFPGKGVRGDINGKRILMGNLDFLNSSCASITKDQLQTFKSFLRQGRTVVGLTIENTLKGWFIISDTLRNETVDVIKVLKGRNYRITLLTGDHRDSALFIAKDAGIEQDIDNGKESNTVISEVSPVEKAAVIKALKRRGVTVIMIGDGINDAPALVEADVGVALAKATDIAIQSADVVLIKNDLLLVPRFLTLSRLTLRIIKQNLFWAFSYNLVMIPLAVSGKIHPIFSAALMALSSLIVVGNSLRLRTYRNTA